jgi:nitrogen fixation/metabolism regulation signal transduction histidine kinase
VKYIVFLSAILGAVLLYLLSNASANTAASGEHYAILVTLNIGLAVLLVTLIVVQLWGLYRKIRQRVVGSRFTLRLLASFALMALLPGLIVYLVSVNFLTRSIESWFNVKVESALEGGLNLGRTAIDILLADVKDKGEGMATLLAFQPTSSHYAMLNDLREKSGIKEATLLSSQGRILSVSSIGSDSFLPELPNVSQLRQARLRAYSNIEPIDGKGLYLRVLVPVNMQDFSGETRILQLMQPVPPSLAATAEAVQDVYQDYQQLSYSRNALREVFFLTLTLVMMLAVLTAVAIAFVVSRRLTAPLTVLAEGTKAIASGDYNTVLPAHGKDELGVLVQSFNSMTQQLSDANKAADNNRTRVEAAREYLQTVLSYLSSGVLALNERGELRTFNNAATQILDINLAQYVGLSLQQISLKHARLAHFLGSVSANYDATELRKESADAMAVPAKQTSFKATPFKEDKQTQIELATAHGKQILTLRGTHLPDGGYVAVFDDATNMIQAQRDAAWGEVARRLAHEIKNPLTPIQLSAERMAHKLSHKLDTADAEMLKRSTATIVNQVSAMKTMVNEFSEYARAPAPQLQHLDLNALIKEVVSLYDSPGVDIVLDLTPTNALIEGDKTMLRQVLHNLLQNAQDALSEVEVPKIIVNTKAQGLTLHLSITDNGGGFAPEMMLHAFEPYMTTKNHGTGLGLAIVKKIIEEHKGSIEIENANVIQANISAQQITGARVSIYLPLLAVV